MIDKVEEVLGEYRDKKLAGKSVESLSLLCNAM